MWFSRSLMIICAFVLMSGCTVRVLYSGPPSTGNVSVVYHLRNTMVGLEFKVRQDSIGNVYYAVYSSDPGLLSASAVKSAATGGLAGALVANGTIAVTAANSDVIQNINTLADKQLYYLVAVGESAKGLDSDSHVRKYSKVLPKSMTELSYVKAGAPGIGDLVRYAASVPQDYYDNPGVNYPIMIWEHGNGESFNDASNAESNFTSLAPLMGPFKRLSNDLYGIPMIVIAAQCNYAYFACANQSEPTIHKEAYDDALTKFRIDTKRVYSVGLSYGGQGVLTFANQYPTLVSAVVFLGSYSTVNVPVTLCGNLGPNNVPVWAIINQNDALMPINNTQQNISDLRACASYTNPEAKARITVVPAGTYPETVDGLHHGSIENLAMSLPYWNGANWKYWNGAAEVTDTTPPTHPAAFAPILLSGTPGNTPGNPIISQDSFITVGAELGIPINSIYDYLLHFKKP